MHSWVKTVLLIIALLLLFTVAAAQMVSEPKQMQCKMPDGHAMGTDVVLKGEVQSLEPHECEMGMKCVHLTVKTDSNVVKVHVGSEQFVKDSGWSFEKGDLLEITGARNDDMVAARTIKKADKTLVLSDDNGMMMCCQH